jgi:hypothetical protein
MANNPARALAPGMSGTSARNSRPNRYPQMKLAFLVGAAVLLASLVVAQGTPQITGVDPSSGKVNETVTVMGQNLGKDAVSSVFLSDDKSDFKATVVEQVADKIVFKIPQVKAGSYNISIQVGDKIFIKPVRFTVQE